MGKNFIGDIDHILNLAFELSFSHEMIKFLQNMEIQALLVLYLKA